MGNYTGLRDGSSHGLRRRRERVVRDAADVEFRSSRTLGVCVSSFRSG